jgi:hypothetical protein
VAVLVVTKVLLHEAAPGRSATGRNANRSAASRHGWALRHSEPNISADLILVGVSTRGAIARQIFGATAARLILIAGRPVLAVPELTQRAAASLNSRDIPVAA